MGNNILGEQTSRIYDSEHISPSSTIGSTTPGNHCTSSLMSLNPLASAFLPHFQSSSDPPISLGNSTTMSFRLAQVFCGMPPQITPSHVLSINQHITHGTYLLPLFQPSNQSKPSRMQQHINQLLVLQLFRPYLSNIKQIVYRLFARVSNNLTNT